VDKLLPEAFAIVGVGRKDFDDNGYRDFAKDGIQQFSRRPIDAASWDTFARHLFFVAADIQDAAAFPAIGSRLDTIEHENGLTGNRIYYLAVPPTMFVPTVNQLAHARFIAPPDSPTYARLIIEKPIGHD
jgi:glucose-6-phosphate 1-dehydrogenase